jgi:hypothetical protein
MKTLLIILLLLINSAVQAQTDIIEYRSHAGNMIKFTQNSTRTIDGVLTNFGGKQMPMVKNAALDTVRFITKNIAVMVTSEYCSYALRSPILDEFGCEIGKTPLGRLWRAGNDTLINHPLFSKKHSLDSIKEILSSTYNFQNSIDSVVFIGFDNEEIGMLEIIASPEDDNKIEPTTNSFGFGLLLIIVLPIFLLYIFSPLAYKWAKG